MIVEGEMLNICFGYRESEMLAKSVGEEFTYSHRHLDLGRVGGNFNEERKAWLVDFYDICKVEERVKVWQEDCKRLERIIARAKTDKVIRVWTASTPCSKCGFYHLVYSLRGVDCALLIVEMPDTAGIREKDCDRAWSEATESEMKNSLVLERELSKGERESIEKKWEKLASENALLRLNIGGEVTSVSEDYLDGTILGFAPKNGRFSLGSLVAKTLSSCPHGVSDLFIAHRIEYLIAIGALEVASERPKKRYDYYSKTMLRRKNG